ncbi:beta-ketoacyl-[acyl-carrier-protein] synthase family protein [bacterium]|nr:beta-ketoacyl-[acyl-carrier-protein] synthase family protein [bacterium]
MIPYSSDDADVCEATFSAATVEDKPLTLARIPSLIILLSCMSTPRVVITGIGLITPLGSDRETSWVRYCAGDSGLRWLPVDASAPGALLWPEGSAGGPVPLDDTLPEKLAARGRSDLAPLIAEPVISLALSAALEAAADAGLDDARALGDRAAAVIGTSKGGMYSAFQDTLRAHADPVSSSTESSSDFWWPRLCPSGAATTVAALFGTQAAALAPVAACATGLISLIRAAELIQSGHCDIVLAGSSDASLTPAIVASFRRLGVLARSFEKPATAIRPCDESRDGFLIGEGAAVFVLESAEHAARRNAKPYAEWLAGCLAADAAGLTQLADNPEALRRLLRDVLRRGQITPDDLDLISLHGTATRTNDVCETAALDAELATRHRPAASTGSVSPDTTTGLRVPSFSAKGSIGHLLGAAGSVEFALTLLALRDSLAPPTANLTSPLATQTLDLVAGEPAPRALRHALKLSLGFGGHLAAAVVRRADR